MQDQVLQFINDHNLFGKEHKLLVAVSGGQDSVVLLHYLHAMGFSLAVAHCNFQLRGKESDDDEAFVKALAARMGLPFHIQKFNTEAFSKGLKLSTQEAARELRYVWIYELLEVHEYDFVATAHHLQDQTETLLINQIRGTGLKGMRGIPAKNDLIVRPFLYTDKVDIDFYAKTNSIAWRHDSSNESEKYLRNAIRKSVIPALKKIEPSLDFVFAKNARKAGESHALLTHFLDEVVGEVVDNEGVEGDFRISIPSLEVYPQAHLILYHFLNKVGFNYEQCIQVASLLEAESGKMVQNEDYAVWRDRRFLLVRRVDNIPFSLEINGVGTYEFPYGVLEVSEIANQNIDFKKTPRHQCLIDSGKINFPLVVRNWEEGDKFRPLGMSGTKLVSDFFIDLKLPVFQKKQVPIVVSNNQIVWVGGFRPDHRFKVDSDSSSVLQITFTKV
jgi:tRNA(Ile)-lysidine synthase